jgi:hypothetical protein
MNDPVHRVAVSDPDSGKEIHASVVTAGDDLVVTVGGGEKPHVGCVVLATPVSSRSNPGTWSASCSVLTIPPHKEEPIARSVASMVAAASGRVTVVTAGVHDDGLDRSGVEIYLELGDRLAEEIAEFARHLPRHTD